MTECGALFDALFFHAEMDASAIGHCERLKRAECSVDEDCIDMTNHDYILSNSDRRAMRQPTRSHSKASHAASRHPPDAPSLPAATREWQAFGCGTSTSSRYNAGMSVETQELLSICEQLPEAKRVELADFARFLLAREGDERWEQIISETKPRPKLEAFLKESAGEGSEPMDLKRL